MNAGDLGLYVGGGAINLGFEKALTEAGQDTAKYTELHKGLLDKANATPGRTVFLVKVGLEGNEDILAASAKVDKELDPAKPDGLCVVTVFREDKRPYCAQNVGMVYVVGPLGATKRAGREPSCPKPEFLLRVQRTAKNAIEAATQLNLRAGRSKPGGPGLAWPRLEVLRVCLVSGGVYKHPQATKEEVAKALIKGLLLSFDPRNSPTLDFAYDEDAFKKAYEDLTRSPA